MLNNSQIHFSLKGFTSILIGAYFLLGSYVIKTLLNGFLIDDNPASVLSVKTIEVAIIVISFLVFLFSSLAIFFSGKRNAKKSQIKLWNPKTKTALWKYIVGILFIFTTLFVLLNAGFIDYLTPIFLIFYAILLFIFKNKERENILILSGLCVLFATVCLLIPSYWYSSLSILGIAHITYGVVVK